MIEPAKRILVVDDDSSIQELLELVLEQEGYSVDVARDGLEGLERIDDAVPDLVILDLMMPRMDGVQFTHELERRGLRSDIPILVLSAARAESALAGAAHGDAYVDKPFNLPDFLREVARLCR